MKEGRVHQKLTALSKALFLCLNLNMKIYFAGSIRAGRGDAEKYKKIIDILKNYGTVFTEHIGDTKLSSDGEANLSEEYIYKRDTKWLESSDVLVAEATVPSLGVGIEIEKALEQKKRVLCLYEKQDGKKLSAMVMGCPEIEVLEYTTLEEVERKIREFLG